FSVLRRGKGGASCLKPFCEIFHEEEIGVVKAWVIRGEQVLLLTTRRGCKGKAEHYGDGDRSTRNNDLHHNLTSQEITTSMFNECPVHIPESFVGREQTGIANAFFRDTCCVQPVRGTIIHGTSFYQQHLAVTLICGDLSNTLICDFVNV